MVDERYVKVGDFVEFSKSGGFIVTTAKVIGITNTIFGNKRYMLEWKSIDHYGREASFTGWCKSRHLLRIRPDLYGKTGV